MALLVLLLVPVALSQADSRAVFVANHGNLEGSVTAFRVDPNGMLTFVNRIITGTRPSFSDPCPGCNPYEISLSPDGRHLVTGHASGNEVPEGLTFFRVNADASITLIQLFEILGTPMDVQWIDNELLAALRTDPSPDKVVVYRFDPAVPSITQVDLKDSGTFCAYIALHPSRDSLYVNDTGSSPYTVRVFSIGPTGVLTLIQTDTTGSYYPLELALTHDGKRMYAGGGITHVVLGWDVDMDGTISHMATWPFPEFGTSPSNVAVSADDRYLLVGHGTDATVRSASIDAGTGNLTYTGHMFDVGLQGTLGDVQVLDDFFFVTDNSTSLDGIMGIYSFRLNGDGSFTQNGPYVSTQGVTPRAIATWSPPPTGACCESDGSCRLTAPGACGGAWQGGDTLCSPNPCPQPGACCAGADSCTVTLETACDGIWQGAGSVCVPNPCAPRVCRGNANCDGAITWRDIDYFVAGMNDNESLWWAEFSPGSPTCAFDNCDVNADGHVTWRDINAFVAVMNTTCP